MITRSINAILQYVSGIKENSNKANVNKNSWEFVNWGGWENGLYKTKLNTKDHPSLNSLFNKVANDLSQVEISHIDKNKKKYKTGLNLFLDGYVNKLDTLNSLLQKIAYSLMIDSNAFITIGRDNKGTVKELVILDNSKVEILQDENTNKLYVSLSLENNEVLYIPYSNVIHLKIRHRDGVYGSPILESLKSALNLINVNEEVIDKLLKTSTNLRGVLKFNMNVHKKNMLQSEKSISSEYFDYKKSNPIMVLDQGSEYHDLSSKYNVKNVVLDEKQSEYLENKVYSLFNISPKIVKGTSNQDEWGTYINNIINPIIQQLSKELTLKILTKSQILRGDKINISSFKLSFNAMPLRDRTKLAIDAFNGGLFTINENRDLYGLTAIEKGDVVRVSLNSVNNEIADEYQMSKGDNRLRSNNQEKEKEEK